MLPTIRLLTALFGLKVRQITFTMASLEESKRIGFQDKDIEEYNEFMSKFDPETNKIVKRMKELIDYKSKF